MQIREWVINKLLPENKTIITKEELSGLKFEASHKECTNIIKEPEKSKKRNTYPNRHIWGESTPTTGVIKYYVNDKSYVYTFIVDGKQKRFKSKDKDKIINFKDRFLKTDKTGEDFTKLASEFNPKYNYSSNNRKNGIYPTSNGRVSVRSQYGHFGTVDTEDQAEYVRAYLEYKGFPEDLKSKNVLGHTCKRNNDYYEHMRLLIRTDTEYLTKHDDKKHLTQRDKINILIDEIKDISDNYGGSAPLNVIYGNMEDKYNINELKVEDLITLLTSKGVIYKPTTDHYKVA